MKKIAAIGLWIIGLALVLALIAHLGFAEIGRTLATVGWGFIVVCAFYPFAIMVDNICWHLLLPPGQRLSILELTWPRWVCDAVNALLPVAQVGGDLIRARMIMRRGISGAAAGASVVADLTSGVVTEIIFSLMGISLLVQRGGHRNIVVAALLGVGLFILFVYGFYLAQRFGLFGRLARLFEHLVQGGEWNSVVGAAEALDTTLIDTYRRRGDFLAASFWRMVGWLLGSSEVYFALYFLGHPVSVGEAMLLESMGQALRHAAFFMPGGLGVQEGTFIMLGAAVGLSAEVSLSLSLVKRVREIVLNLPPLLIWHFNEGRQLLRRAERA